MFFSEEKLKSFYYTFREWDKQKSGTVNSENCPDGFVEGSGYVNYTEFLIRCLDFKQIDRADFAAVIRFLNTSEEESISGESLVQRVEKKCNVKI